MLPEDGQEIIASCGRVPNHRAVTAKAQGSEKLNFVPDALSDGDDWNKWYEQFRNILVQQGSKGIEHETPFN